MSKNLNTFSALNSFIKENNCFEINNNELFCYVCNKKRTYLPKEGVKSLKKHIISSLHKQNLERRCKQERIPFQKIIHNQDSFH